MTSEIVFAVIGILSVAGGSAVFALWIYRVVKVWKATKGGTRPLPPSWPGVTGRERGR